MKSLSLFTFSLSLMFFGCAQDLNNISNVISVESDVTVGVKKAYITEKTDAKSRIISELKFDEKLNVTEAVDNNQWFKVLTPGKEGFIPKSSTIEPTFADTTGRALGTIWETLKGKDSKNKTTFDSSGKNWSEEERADRSVKNFGNSQNNINSGKAKYKLEDIENLLLNMSDMNSSNQITNFRKEGGLK